MKSDIKAQWIAALRSGEYEQGHGLLHPTDNTYCCLGVLCDLHAKAGLGMWVDDRYNGVLEVLPIDVQVWAQLQDWCPDVSIPVDGDVGRFTLAEINDGRPVDGIRPHTFAEIADLIEQQL